MSKKLNFKASTGWQCNRTRVKIYVDLENACGGSHAICAHQETIKQMVLGLRDQYAAQVTYSVGPMALQSYPTLMWDWSFARFIPGRGLDGADLALIGAIENEPFQENIDSLILVSGDHIFANQIKQLKEFGISTTVISLQGALSNQLRKVATSIQYLPENQTLAIPRRTA